MLKSDDAADSTAVTLFDCPFCGSDQYDFIAPYMDLDYLCIQCRDCSSRGPLAETGREAMRRWNERRSRFR